MVCAGNRVFDQNHPTCRSCVKQLGPCVQQQKKKRRDTSDVTSWYRGGIFVTTQSLYSMNHWHGRPRHIYTAYRREWEKVLTGTWALWGKAAGKRHLQVHRFVASEGHMVKDRDNLIGALKPVKDVLVKIGVLLDDTDELCSFDIQQHIERQARVEIEVSDDKQHRPDVA